MESLASDVLWVVYVGFALSFLLSFGVGANDVANSFVTSIGSGVLTLRQAKIIASICEASGAILLGYKVSETMRKGILEVSVYKHSEKELMFGCLAALASSCIWMLVVTCFKLPVSATHSLVGAIIGFSIFDRGTKGINWFIAGEIALSWAIAPVLSGICSLLLYLALYKLVVTTKHPLKAGFISLPIFCGLTFFVNVISILVLNTGSPIIQEIPSWIGWLVSIAVGLLAAVLTQFILVPIEKRRIAKRRAASVKELDSSGGSIDGLQRLEELRTKEAEDEKVQTGLLFSFLQIVSAAFGSFAHGANDVRQAHRHRRFRSCFQSVLLIYSNGISPLVAIYGIYNKGCVMQESQTPIEILVYGSFGIVVGIWVLGHLVMENIGKSLTHLTPISGFAIEGGSALIVFLATFFGYPVSTTHCKVGSLVVVGYTAAILQRMERKRRAAAAALANLPSIRRSKRRSPRKTVSWGLTSVRQIKTGSLPPEYGVNWTLVRNILLAWFFTMPATMGVSALLMQLLVLYIPM